MTKTQISGATIAGFAVIVWYGAHHWHNVSRENAREVPRLEYVSQRFDKGDLILTVRNSSTVTPAALGSITFTVRDEKMLDRIARKYPRKATSLEIHTSANPTDVITFKHGRWQPAGSFEFYATGECFIAPGEPNSLRCGILDTKLAGIPLCGTISAEVWHDGGETAFLFEDLFITPRPSRESDE